MEAYRELTLNEYVHGQSGRYLIKSVYRKNEIVTIYKAFTVNNESCYVKYYRRPINPRVRTLVGLALGKLPADCNIVKPIDSGNLDEAFFDVFPEYYGEDYGKKGRIDQAFLVQTMLPQIAKALSAIHKVGLTHCALRPENLYLDEKNNRILVGDFENCMYLASDPRFNPVAFDKGLKGYLAPEISEKPTYNSDYYSLGITITSLLTGRYIFQDTDDYTIFEKIVNNSFQFIVKDLRMRNLIRGLTLANQKQRFGEKELNAFLTNQSLKQLDEEDKSREFKEEYPYYFEMTSYPDMKELAHAFLEKWGKAIEHFKRGLIERYFSENKPELYAAMKDAFDIENPDLALSRILYILNPELGICYQGKTYASLETIAFEMNKTYPKINESLLTLIKSKTLYGYYAIDANATIGSVTQVSYNLLKQIQNMTDDNLIYYYFLFYNLKTTGLPSIFIGEQSYEDLKKLGSYILISDDPVKMTNELAHNPLFQALYCTLLGIKRGRDLIFSLDSKSTREIHLDILVAFEELTEMSYNAIAYSGFSKWLAENYKKYQYVGKKAKALQRRFDALATEIKRLSIASLKGYYKIIIRIEECYETFEKLFNYTLIRPNHRDGINATNNEYYLGLEYNKETVCIAYLKQFELSNIDELEEELVDRAIGNSINQLNNSNNKLEEVKREAKAKVDRRDSEYRRLGVKTYHIISIIFITMITILIYIFAHYNYLWIPYVEIELANSFIFAIFIILILSSIFHLWRIQKFLLFEKSIYKELDSIGLEIARNIDYYESTRDKRERNLMLFKKNKNLFNKKHAKSNYLFGIGNLRNDLAAHSNEDMPSLSIKGFLLKLSMIFSLAVITVSLSATFYEFLINTPLYKAYSGISFAIAMLISVVVNFATTVMIKNFHAKSFTLLRFLLGMLIGVVTALVALYGLSYIATSLPPSLSI